ncbi:ABC transporter permease [Aquipuribacter sp. SD81]|uniref:ABC transporter permease n=1 Tax=Aquipuribacter sp. SD81 TaxID=3127703 RepID=UPI003017018D
MSTGTPVRGRHVAPGQVHPDPPTRSSRATGTWSLLRFALRRDRVRLPVWVAAAAGLVAVQSVASQGTYDTPQALAGYAEVAQANAAVIAMTGRPVGLETVERAVAFEIYAVVAVLVGLMSVFTVVRHTRADEAEGRTELVLAAAVGRRAPLLAALGTAVVANLAVVAATWAAAVVTGLPPAGSLLLGASFGAVGLAFAGITAVAAQLVENGRPASAVGGAAVAVAFALRAAGDVQDSALTWLSPIGWGQAAYPFWLDRWWPLLLPVLAFVLLGAVALALLDRRDVGAGLLAARPGTATAGPLLRGPAGLAWRLQRGTVTGWGVGLLAAGVVYGSLVTATADLVEQAPELLDMIPGGADSIVDGYLVITVFFLAVLAACAGVAMVLRLRGEEQSGRAEPVLATPVARARWAASHVAVGLVVPTAALLFAALACGLTAVATGSPTAVVGDALRGALVTAPAVWVLVAATVALWGLGTRLAPLAWLLVAWTGVVLVLGDSLDLPGWARAVSPLHHVPQVPLEAASAGAPLALAGVAVVLLGLGLAAFRRRDLTTG